LAVLAKIGTESENAVSAFLPFQCLGGTENGRASCPAGNAEYFGVSLMLCAMPCLSVAILGASWGPRNIAFLAIYETQSENAVSALLQSSSALVLEGWRASCPAQAPRIRRGALM
jgi:hypothetical protein